MFQHSKWDQVVKGNCKEVGYEDVQWIHVAHE
jgi:hypothetical protein